MTKRHVMQPNGVWTYEVTLDPVAEVIPVLSPAHLAAWIDALNSRLGAVCCRAGDVRRELMIADVQVIDGVLVQGGVRP